MPKSQWEKDYESWTDAERARFKERMTGKEAEPEKPPDEPSFGMARLRRGYEQTDDPSEVRKERRGL